MNNKENVGSLKKIRSKVDQINDTGTYKKISQSYKSLAQPDEKEKRIIQSYKKSEKNTGMQKYEMPYGKNKLQRDKLSTTDTTLNINSKINLS